MSKSQSVRNLDGFTVHHISELLRTPLFPNKAIDQILLILSAEVGRSNSPNAFRIFSFISRQPKRHFALNTVKRFLMFLQESSPNPTPLGLQPSSHGCFGDVLTHVLHRRRLKRGPARWHTIPQFMTVSTVSTWKMMITTG